MVIGIVAEWNPFHEGHRYLISEIKKKFPYASVVCAMSGSFVQRGEPAVFDKWIRARWAVLCGADLVIELPAVSVLQSADHFAEAGVLLLSALRVDALAFGTESLRADALSACARLSLSENFRPALKAELSKGVPYSRAVNAALSEKFPEISAELEKPNNLLGIRYAAASEKHGLRVSLIPIRRPGEPAISATKIREEIRAGISPSFIPEEIRADVFRKLSAGEYTDPARYDDACLLASRKLSAETLSASGLFNEGLENRWKRETLRPRYEDMLSAIKSKRYLYSRLRRVGAALLLSNEFPSPFAAPVPPSYIRLLALRRGKSTLLRNAGLPVVTSFSYGERTLLRRARKLLRLDALATDLQAWCRKSPDSRAGGDDYFHSPEIVD